MKETGELIGDAVPSGIAASRISVELYSEADLSTDAGRWLAAHVVPAGDLRATAGRTDAARQIRKWKHRLELRRELRAIGGGLR